MKNKWLTLVCLALTLSSAHGQDLDATKLAHGIADSWPTYNGDYSGRRYSTLSVINSSNVDSLSLAWVHRINTAGIASYIGPVGSIKSTPLVVGGVMYFSMPDNVWALDARTGRELWHYAWQSKGGIHLGNRGVGIFGNWLYVETPDCHLVSLNLSDGKERWDKEICDLDRLYYASSAPVVIKNHVIVGVSGDNTDIPGYLESRNPETGDLQWRWNSVPKPGEPGAETWPNAEAMAHGGGMTWVPCTYDADLNLIYLGTGNPQPVIAGKGRLGDDLFTESIVALDLDTGKLKWYFQPSPHDTHDWDAIGTPVLFDGLINGSPRKLLAQASRNGWFFVLDRTNGKSIVTTEFVKTNWAKGIDARGEPIPNPAKLPTPDGTLTSPNQGGAANWPSPTFDPDTGLFYVDATRAFSMYYIFDNTNKPEGWGGNDRGGWAESMLEGIDYATGKVRWAHKWEGSGRSGLLSTAGNLVFVGDPSNNFVAINATNGLPLWHATFDSLVSTAPITYRLDETQYVVVGAGDTLYAFAMCKK